jgi:hypothetical protein
MNFHSNKSWVVYQTPIRNQPGSANAVCEQSEWDAMEISRPGFCRLIRAGIVSEGEAEQIARTTPVAEKVA